MADSKAPITLSPDDVRVLKELARSVNMLRENSQIHNQSEQHRVSPDVYIAKPQTTITAMVGSTPGTGLADIYYLDPSTGLFVKQGLYLTIYNLSPSSYSTTSNLLVNKDKFGKWWLNSVGGVAMASGRATTAVSAAASPLVGIGFTFRKFLVSNPATTPQTLAEEAVDIVAVNRWTLVSGPVDSLVLCANIDGEWRLVELQPVCP